MPRCVSLHEFMPYGAPDLIAAAPQRLTRAVVVASGLAILLFALAMLIPRPRMGAELALTAHVMLPPPLYDSPRAMVVRPLHPVMSSNAGRFVPVEAQPPDVTFDVPPSMDVEPGSGTKWIGTSLDSSRPSEFMPPPPPPSTEPYLADELPVPLKRVEPEYPYDAREAGIDGTVVVHVLVGRDGTVLEATADPKLSVPMLESAALDAARRWRFKPGLANGHPVPVRIAIPFVFRLH